MSVLLYALCTLSIYCIYYVTCPPWRYGSLKALTNKCIHIDILGKQLAIVYQYKIHMGYPFAHAPKSLLQKEHEGSKGACAIMRDNGDTTRGSGGVEC
ncbi:hypothetical protein XELAEV_18031257mg [Xenopus laevis]|uniref:Uncharacterized protein n=1 Tax=Xenopus laevis TaxID=8355 RepID=A0A974HFK6_XENLA|nr:hypothetical protein XELAEV_18031257mg [Xenopus laevis]